MTLPNMPLCSQKNVDEEAVEMSVGGSESFVKLSVRIRKETVGCFFFAILCFVSFCLIVEYRQSSEDRGFVRFPAMTDSQFEAIGDVTEAPMEIEQDSLFSALSKLQQANSNSQKPNSQIPNSQKPDSQKPDSQNTVPDSLLFPSPPPPPPYQDDGKCEEDRLKPGWLEEAAARRQAYPPIEGGLDTKKRYMLYTLCNDYCAGVLHTSRALWGQLAEAKRLNRTAVWNLLCIGPHHNKGVLEVKDPGVIFDKPRVAREYVPIIDEAEFWGRLKKTGLENVSHRKVDPNVKTGDLLDEEATILERDYTGHWNKFVFSLKDDPENNARQAEIWYAPHNLMLADMFMIALNNGDYDAAHVRRGDKAKRIRQWPNLEKDTRPERLVEKLPKYVELGRTLYIATDESKPGFFDPLKEMYTVKIQDDFSAFWNMTSHWWKANIEADGDKKLPTFDNYQRAIVDYIVTEKAKTRVETFPHLTTDSWYP